MISQNTDLDQLIAQENPFHSQVVTQYSIWDDESCSVPEINQKAFAEVLKRINNVQEKKQPSTGTIIIGEKGQGKSQLLGRLYQYLKQKDQFLFVYMGQYDDLNNLKPEFLQALVYSLKREHSPGVSQWQSLAAAMYFDARGNVPCSVGHLVKQFPKILTSDPQILDKWVVMIAQKCPEVKDLNLIRAIIWTLSSNALPYAAMWLGGTPLSSESARKLELPEHNSSLITYDLLNLITRYKTVVCCFDELDAPIAFPSDAGFTLLQVGAGLAKELLDQVKGVVVILTLFPQKLSEIMEGDSSLGGAAYDRFLKPEIKLELLDVDASLALIAYRLQQFYEKHQVTPPDRFYPFQEKTLRSTFAQEKSRARAVLAWCEQNWRLPNSTSNPDQSTATITTNKIEACYNDQIKRIEDEIVELMESQEKIAAALRLAFTWLQDKVVDDLKVGVIEDADKAYCAIVSFKVSCRLATNVSGPFDWIGIVVSQKTGRSLTTDLAKLIKFNQLPLTRACIVRAKEITGDKAQEHVATLLKQGGEWVALREEHIMPLVALYNMKKSLAHYELTEEEIKNYAETILPINPLIREILSKPDGNIPDNLKPADVINFRNDPREIADPTTTAQNPSGTKNSSNTQDKIDELLKENND